MSGAQPSVAAIAQAGSLPSTAVTVLLNLIVLPFIFITVA
jgi:hypothetical protein